MLPPPTGQRRCCKKLSFLAARKNVRPNFISHTPLFSTFCSFSLNCYVSTLQLPVPRSPISVTLKAFLTALLTVSIMLLRIELLFTFVYMRAAQEKPASSFSTKASPSQRSLMEGRGTIIFFFLTGVT